MTFAVRWLLLLLIAIPLALLRLPAQEQIIVHTAGDRQICSVKITPYAGSQKPGGLGFVLVDAQNLDGNPHALRVRYDSRSWVGNNVGAGRSLVLLANERARFFLPLPTLDRTGFELNVAIDGTTYIEDLQPSSKRGSTALVVSDRPQLLPAVLALAKSVWPDDKRISAAAVGCGTRDTPDDWRLFTAFDLVVVDGRSDVGRGTQEALRRFAHAGGQVLVFDADRLSSGALRDRLERLSGSGTASVRHGLGVLIGSRLELDTSALQMELRSQSRSAIWPLAESFQQPQRIPGLDQAPVLVFLFVILLFAVAVGPVNFFLLRRARRPMLALITVPALGFGTTLLMFGYGAFSDGFGVRGVVRSWTVLDQQNREAATVTARTLFAGLAQGAFDLGDDSLLLAPGAFDRSDQRSRHRWSYEAETGQLEGGALPARTPTALQSARQGITRDRLRAQVRGDGDLDLLADGGVAAVGEVVLRDPEGAYWTGTAPRLQRCHVAAATLGLERLQRDMRIHEVAEDAGHEIVTLDGLATRLFDGLELPNGTYVTRVAKAPWLPEHGMDVAYEAQEHWVVGTLGAEDFLR